MRSASFTARASRALASRLPVLLVDPAYRRLWLSGLLYYIANATDVVTAGWAVLEMTNSPFMVGIAGFCRMIPMLILGMLSMVIGLMPFGILISGGLSSLIGPSLSIASMCLIGVGILLVIALRNREILHM